MNECKQSRVQRIAQVDDVFVHSARQLVSVVVWTPYVRMMEQHYLDKFIRDGDVTEDIVNHTEGELMFGNKVRIGKVKMFGHRLRKSS